MGNAIPACRNRCGGREFRSSRPTWYGSLVLIPGVPSIDLLALKQKSIGPLKQDGYISFALSKKHGRVKENGWLDL
jgi:hypothetical protein